MMMKQQLDSNKKEQEILDLWNIINDTQCEYSKDKFIYMLFEEQAKRMWYWKLMEPKQFLIFNFMNIK